MALSLGAEYYLGIICDLVICLVICVGFCCSLINVCGFCKFLWDDFLGPALGMSADVKKAGAWAVVTGCTDGIGKAYAQQLAGRGLNMVLISRSKSKLYALAKELETKYRVLTRTIAVDFTKTDIYGKIDEEIEGLEIGTLVNNFEMFFECWRLTYFLKDQRIHDLMNCNKTSTDLSFVVGLGPGIQNLHKDKGMIEQVFVDYFSKGQQMEYKDMGIIEQPKTVTRGKYRANYSQDDMEQAFNYVFENNVSAQRAFSIFNVPVSTLKDRINGKINIDTLKSGPPPMFTQLEEAVLAQHLVTMGEIGYAYTRQETLNVATDYAIHLGYRDKDHPLSTYWLYSFIERFPELKIQRPRKLEATRAKYATKEAINNYFSRLTEIVRKYGFSERPQSIFNIDEKGLSTDVTPSKFVAGKNCRPQTITSGKSKIVRMLCATSAIGFSVPPYFIFPGQRMRQDLMDEASPGADGTVSKSGWSNTAVFISYMKDHLLKFLPLRDENNKVLVLYDGHKSHVSLSLIEWEKKENIILFVLPPHTSHLLQPLDIGCFGPFETAWEHACHSFLRQSGGKVICKYDICKIACHVHGTVMTAANITSSFKKSGVFPLDSSVVPDSAVAPSLSFPRVNNHVEDIEVARPFLDERGGDVLANATAAKKPRDTLSRIVGGRAITEKDIVDKIREHEEKQGKGKGPSKKKNPQPPPPDGVNVGASTSGIQSKRRKQSTTASQPQHQDSEDNVSLPESDDEEAKCRVCGHFTPKEIRENPYISICNWAQCDDCNHWTHLKFCTAVRFVRTKGSFKCPHCENCTEE